MCRPFSSCRRECLRPPPRTFRLMDEGRSTGSSWRYLVLPSPTVSNSWCRVRPVTPKESLTHVSCNCYDHKSDVTERFELVTSVKSLLRSKRLPYIYGTMYVDSRKFLILSVNCLNVRRTNGEDLKTFSSSLPGATPRYQTGVSEEEES